MSGRQTTLALIQSARRHVAQAEKTRHYWGFSFDKTYVIASICAFFVSRQMGEVRAFSDGRERCCFT
jgi:hypothetical protein